MGTYKLQLRILSKLDGTFYKSSVVCVSALFDEFSPNCMYYLICHLNDRAVCIVQKILYTFFGKESNACVWENILRTHVWTNFVLITVHAFAHRSTDTLQIVGPQIFLRSKDFADIGHDVSHMYKIVKIVSTDKVLWFHSLIVFLS
jgi:hypothetical protein